MRGPAPGLLCRSSSQLPCMEGPCWGCQPTTMAAPAPPHPCPAFTHLHHHFTCHKAHSHVSTFLLIYLRLSDPANDSVGLYFPHTAVVFLACLRMRQQGNRNGKCTHNYSRCRYFTSIKIKKKNKNYTGKVVTDPLLKSHAIFFPVNGNTPGSFICKVFSHVYILMQPAKLCAYIFHFCLKCIVYRIGVVFFFFHSWARRRDLPSDPRKQHL